MRNLAADRIALPAGKSLGAPRRFDRFEPAADFLVGLSLFDGRSLRLAGKCVEIVVDAELAARPSRLLARRFDERRVFVFELPLVAVVLDWICLCRGSRVRQRPPLRNTSSAGSSESFDARSLDRACTLPRSNSPPPLFPQSARNPSCCSNSRSGTMPSKVGLAVPRAERLPMVSCERKSMWPSG